MALYKVANGGVVNSADPDQFVDLLTGVMTDQQVTVSHRIRAQLTGAAGGTGGYVGATTGGPPVSGSFVAGDWVVDTAGNMWICTSAGSPGRWVPSAGTIVARGNRQTSSATTTTEVGVLKVTAALKQGQLYTVQVASMYLVSTTGGDGIGASIRYTTDGTEPTTSSTRLGSVHATAGGSSPAEPLLLKYAPASDLTFKALLTVARWSGSGTVSMVVDTNHPAIDLMIVAMGADPGDTGVDI